MFRHVGPRLRPDSYARRASLSRCELHYRRVEDADPVEHKGEEPDGERDRRGCHYRLSPEPAALLALVARGDEVGHRRRDEPGEVVAVLLEGALERLAPFARVVGESFLEHRRIVVEELAGAEFIRLPRACGNSQTRSSAWRSASCPWCAAS